MSEFLSSSLCSEIQEMTSGQKCILQTPTDSSLSLNDESTRTAASTAEMQSYLTSVATATDETKRSDMMTSGRPRRFVFAGAGAAAASMRSANGGSSRGAGGVSSSV